MSYEIIFSPTATKYIEKLPKQIGEYRAIIDADFEKQILKVRVFDIRGRIYER